MKALNLVTPALAICLLSMVSCLTLAQADDHRRHGHKPPMFKNQMHLHQQLNLSPEQLALLPKTREENKAQRQELKKLRQSLHNLVQSDNYSYAEVESIARQISEMQYQNLLANAEAHQVFFQSLTEEQKQKATTLHKTKTRRHRQH